MSCKRLHSLNKSTIKSLNNQIKDKEYNHKKLENVQNT